jgi:hypothetical protein
MKIQIYESSSENMNESEQDMNICAYADILCSENPEI